MSRRTAFLRAREAFPPAAEPQRIRLTFTSPRLGFEDGMPDQPQQPQNDRFKAEMPEIPGVSVPARRAGGTSGPWMVVGGLVAVLAAVFLGGKLLSRPHRPDPPPATAQIDVPATAPDLTPVVPVASEADPVVAQVGDLAKPWEARQFSLRNRATGESVTALLLRLPGGSPGHSSAYWSFALKEAYGNCKLEYVEDLGKLRSDYGYRQAKHPMVGNPCSRTLYDPLKYGAVSGGVLARGAIVQGSDLRPPLAIEIKVHGKDILAARME
jgi:hypothetical protein